MEMNNNICRLCLNSILETSERLTNDECPETKIKFLMPEININITPTFVTCTNCTYSLNSGYSFKRMCIEIDEIIKKYATNNETVDLEYVRSQIFLESKQVKADVDIESVSVDNYDTTDIFVENFKSEDIKDSASQSVVCTVFTQATYNQNNDEQNSKMFSQIPEKMEQADESFKEYKCEICSKTFKSNVSLKLHISTHTITEKYFCDVCNKSYKTKGLLKMHVQKHSGKKWICDICGKSFTYSSYLQKHIKHFHCSKYICSTCGMNCHSNNQLTDHVRTHTGERPHKCEFCGKGFAQRSTLGTHIKFIHLSTEKSFICGTCGKAFAAESYLRRHVENHNIVERSFICPQCNKAFKTRNNLRNHIERHSPKKNHKCPVCGREFSQKSKLVLHIRIHTGEKPYECDTCHKTFTQKWNLQTHIKSHRSKSKNI